MNGDGLSHATDCRFTYPTVELSPLMPIGVMVTDRDSAADVWFAPQ